MFSLARVLILFGLILIVIGGVIYIFARFNIPLGRLPGDILIRRDNFTCMIPIVTSILLSILLTVGLNIIIRLLNK